MYINVHRKTIDSKVNVPDICFFKYKSLNKIFWINTKSQILDYAIQHMLCLPLYFDALSCFNVVDGHLLLP